MLESDRIGVKANDFSLAVCTTELLLWYTCVRILILLDILLDHWVKKSLSGEKYFFNLRVSTKNSTVFVLRDIFGTDVKS